MFAHTETGTTRIQTVTAGIVNLVPEGLILLISVTAAVSAFKMSQRGVLAQQLNAIESLASVDVVCTDKTGTLTEPTLRVVGLIPADEQDEASVGRELMTYALSAPSRNLTLDAIAHADLAQVEPKQIVAQVPFSSRRRWSGLGPRRRAAGARRAGAVRRRQPGPRGAGARRGQLGAARARDRPQPSPLPHGDTDPRFPDDVNRSAWS